MLQNYFKPAWRNIWRNKVTSIINIGGLAIGMTAAVLILCWVQHENSFDKFKGSENVYRLTTRLPAQGWVWETTPLLLADAIRNDVPGIENVTRLSTNAVPVFSVKGNFFYEKEAVYVDKYWFNFFPYEFKEGNALSFNENPFSIILSSSEAKKYFGESSAVGQLIRIDTLNYKVTGVVADAPLNSSFRYKAFIPIDAMLTNQQQLENDEQWGNYNYVTFIKTLPGNNAASLSTVISGIIKKKSNDEAAAPVDMIALGNMHFETEIQNSAFVHGNRNTVYIFSFIGFLLLLTACINYVNLTTARASLRAREVSIRKIAGAKRFNLFLQFVAESVLVSLLSLFCTLVLLKLSLPVFNQATGTPFKLPLTSIGLWQVLGTTVFTALLLNSIYPALLLSSFKPLNVFRGVAVLKVGNSSFRRSLVVLQFTISIILIAATIIIYKQMQFIKNSNPGYNRAQVVSFYLPFTMDRQKKQSIMQAIKNDLLASPAIAKVAGASQPAFDIGSYCTACADWQGHDSSFSPKIAQLSADADFLAAMQLQMKEGRWLGEADITGRKGFILNETAVNAFNLPLPATGQPFIFKGDTGQVIGVVKDFKFKSMHEKTGPLVIFNNPGMRSQFVVRTSSGNPAMAIATIKHTWDKFLPATPFEYTFLDDAFNHLYARDLQTSFLVLLFAIIAIIISALGLFSLAAFAAASRTREIGIRKVLGATVTGITALLSREFLKLVCIAILIALPMAWWATDKWLQDFAYRVNNRWWMFVLAGITAILIALITISFQAIKAALANPVKSLRTE